MAAPRKYPDELRKRAIRFALDLVDGAEKLSVNAACKRVGEQLGIVPDSLRNWVQQARIDAGNAPGLSSDERARLVELEREVRELRRANAILKSALGFLRGGARPPLPLIVAFIDGDGHKLEHGVETPDPRNGSRAGPRRLMRRSPVGPGRPCSRSTSGAAAGSGAAGRGSG
jgi:transposase